MLNQIRLSDKGCLGTGSALFRDLTVEELYTDTSGVELPTVVDWQERYNGAGPHSLAAPMLIVQGTKDTLTYAQFTEDDFDETCEAYLESVTDLLLYPGLDHDAVDCRAVCGRQEDDG